jgi:hypothetical protein
MLLRWLCRTFPALRIVWLGAGYVLMMTGGLVWFICFPLTAYTLQTARVFPLEYFGIDFSLPFPLEFFLPRELQVRLVPVCLAFTLWGLIVIYFNVRQLRQLRCTPVSR